MIFRDAKARERENFLGKSYLLEALLSINNLTYFTDQETREGRP